MATNASFQPLTRREREILTLLSQNLSDREIADRLVIAQTTVKWFNQQIFNKLGVETRQQAVHRAQALGLLQSDKSDVGFQQNLPVQLTPFIGRVDELAAMRRWLNNPSTRLITLLAPGGMGKTRLAVEAARTMLDDFSDGVCFVPLAGMTSSDPFISKLIDALGLQFAPDGRTPQQQLFQALRRRQLLLVLDNFEHMLDSAPLVAELLTAAPQVKVLVTSRERLNITGEVLYPLIGLAVADLAGEDEGRWDDAGQLFVVCAQRASPYFTPNDTHSIVRVCRLVQGMPLAIELAAAWANTLSTAEIAHEVEQNADFLHTTMPDVPERLRSVRAVFEAAWARLPDDAKQSFRRMSVFRGGYTREAAQTITGADIRTLALLVDRALLWRSSQTERYEVHELLRQYAEQELQAARELDEMQQAHYRYYAQLAETWGAALLSDQQREGLAILDADIENTRQAFTYATSHANPEAVEPFTDLWFYYDMRSRWGEADDLFKTACDALEPADSLALAKLLTGRAILNQRMIRLQPEYELAKRGYEMTQRLGNRRALPLALIAYADILRDRGEFEEALHLYEEALVTAEEVHYPLMTSIAIYHFAINAALEGQWEHAKTKMTEAYRRAARLNNFWTMCFCLNQLVGFALYTSDFDEAQRLSNQMLEIARSMNFHLAVTFAISRLRRVARERGDWQTIYHLNREALRLPSTAMIEYQFFCALVGVAEAALMLDSLDEARQYLGEAVQLVYGQAVPEEFLQQILGEEIVQPLSVAAGLLIRAGDYKRAAVHLSYAEQILTKSQDLPAFLAKLFTTSVQELLDTCRAALTPDAFTAAVERGKALTLDDVLAELAIIR